MVSDDPFRPLIFKFATRSKSPQGLLSPKTPFGKALGPS
jgi:hypothetical protein